jgi:hypothetical protein
MTKFLVTTGLLLYNIGCLHKKSSLGRAFFARL